jgi:hypothetical protein
VSIGFPLAKLMTSSSNLLSVQPNDTRTLCVAAGLACASCLLICQALMVHIDYSGNWTGLFYTGSEFKPVPLPLRAENVYMFKGSVGYDGQEYHYIAHDPFLTRGFSSSLDDPQYRYRRILVPGLAFLFALGRDRAIDPAYIGVVLLFILMGSYWLARLSVALAYSPWVGLLFGAVPAVLISVARLTVDVALAACCVGFVLYVREQSPYKLYGVLVMATLARETGLILIAAYAIYLLSEKRLREAIVFSTAVVPMACWYLFVRLHTPPIPSANVTRLISLVPFSGLIGRIIHPYPYPFLRVHRWLCDVLDLLALCGIVACLVWAFGRAFRRAWSPLSISIYLFLLMTMILSRGEAWTEVNGFGRTMTPLLLLSALDGMHVGSIWPTLAMLAPDPRIGLDTGLVVRLVHNLLR